MRKHYPVRPIFNISSKTDLDCEFVERERELLTEFRDSQEFNYWERRGFTKQIRKNRRSGILSILENDDAKLFERFVEFCGVKKLETYKKNRGDPMYRRTLYVAMVTKTDQQYGESDVYDGMDGFWAKYREITPFGGIVNKTHFMG